MTKVRGKEVPLCSNLKTDKSEFSRIYNETYYYKILVGITLSVRIAFIDRRRLTYMALCSRLVCENTGNMTPTSDYEYNTLPVECDTIMVIDNTDTN